MQRCVDCRYFDEALRYNPDHRQSLFNSAVLLQELGQPELRPRATQRSVRRSRQALSCRSVMFGVYSGL